MLYEADPFVRFAAACLGVVVSAAIVLALMGAFCALAGWAVWTAL